MAKILFDRTLFQEVSPEGTYESVYEAMITAHGARIWPRFHTVNFKSNLIVNGEGVRADFILVEKSFSEWWIVEVEMPNHNLETHIVPQVKKLTEAVLGDTEAEKIVRASKSRLRLTSVKKMLREVPQRVMVVVSKPKPDWAERLKSLNVLVAVFEMFESHDKRMLFRINGEHPMGDVRVLTECNHFISRWLKVEDSVSLGLQNGTQLQIEFKGKVTTWQVFEEGDVVYLLTPNGPNPLPDGSTYELLQLADQRYSFRKKKS